MAPSRDDLVVAVECLFPWYGLSALCTTRQGLPFVLGPALSMKALPGGQAKNAKSDAHQSAVLLRGGMLPMASVYPPEMRATRELLRRRGHLMRQRAELLAHIQNTNSQYNLPACGKTRADKGHREGGDEHCPAPRVRKSLAMDGALIAHDDQRLGEVARSLPRTATGHDGHPCARVPSVPGSGQLLAWGIRSESQASARCPRVPAFLSSRRLGTGAKQSAGTRPGR